MSSRDSSNGSYYKPDTSNKPTSIPAHEVDGSPQMHSSASSSSSSSSSSSASSNKPWSKGAPSDDSPTKVPAPSRSSEQSFSILPHPAVSFVLSLSAILCLAVYFFPAVIILLILATLVKHHQKTNDPADLDPGAKLRGGGGFNPAVAREYGALHARDPYVPSREIRENLPPPLGEAELQARQEELNKFR